MTSPPSTGPIDCAVDVGDLIEAWPHGTTPAKTKRPPFGASDTPWRGCVRGVTGGAVALALEGDAGWMPVIVPWSRIAWVRIRGRPSPGPGDIPPES